MKFTLGVLASVGCLLSATNGQVKVRGRWEHSPSFAHVDPLIEESYNLPTQDNLKFLEHAIHEDEEQGMLKPYKFGEAIPFTLDINHEGSWTMDEQSGLVTWRAMISSPGASSISLNFKQFRLPDDAELYILGKEEVAGAFTAAINNKESGDFATAPIAGDTVVLEYVQPIPSYLAENKSALLVEAVKEEVLKSALLELESVVHGFRWTPRRTHFSGRCNVDAACQQGNKHRDQIRSVGIVITDKGQRYCSGAVVNNPREDGRQLFLTAAHCVVGDTTKYIVGFNYQYEKCHSELGPNSVVKEIPFIQSVQGLKLLGMFEPSDFAVFEILEHIPDDYNVFYAGWNCQDAFPKNVLGVHHPSGDVKKVSYYPDELVPAAWKEAPRAFHMKVKAWKDGSTEQGSSGSPLFNQEGLIVGHLHGGLASCSYRGGFDLYGRLSSDWDGAEEANIKPGALPNCLKHILDPDGQNIMSITGSYYKTVDGKRVPTTKATVTYREKSYVKPPMNYRVTNYMR